MKDFRIASLPELVFGMGAVYSLGERLAENGMNRITVITGGKSLDESGAWERIAQSLDRSSISYERLTVTGEPSPALVDQHAEAAAAAEVQGIIGIGGGSAIDTAKAVSAMVLEPEGVRNYLEGVGTAKPSGKRLYLAAVPTTAGTGSEATKNAVISEVGEKGFKKSLRHDRYIPDLAVLDPLLALPCPPSVTAASGLDAVTQLLESYVSAHANAFTDALALDGLAKAGRGFKRAVQAGRDEEARGDMAYAACLSGITLSHAGLGVVHGAAGVLGSICPIPHGTACGTLLAESTKLIIEKLEASSSPAHREAYRKYAQAGYALTGDPGAFELKRGTRLLLDQLFSWQELLSDARLAHYDLDTSVLHHAAYKTDVKNTPVQIDPQEIEALFIGRL